MPAKPAAKPQTKPAVDSSTHTTDGEDDPIVDGTATRLGDDIPATATGTEIQAISAIPQRHLILSNEDRQTMHTLITASLGAEGKNVTPEEFNYFMRVCELRGVNPLFREAYLIKERDGRINIQVGIDGFRKLAEETGEYRGQTKADWTGPDYDGTVPAFIGKPGHVTVGVIREGFDEPLYGECWLEEDGQVKEDGTPIGQWGQRTRTMMRKVAEARAIRAAFPRSVSGLYTEDELPGTGARLVGSGEGRPVAPGEAGATESGAAPEKGTWSPPTPPAAPEGLQGVLQQDADGIRRVTPNSEVSGRHGLRGKPVDKVEVIVKVRNKKHTLMLFEGQAHAADAAQLKAAEVIVFKGVVEELDYPNREDKPMRKEVWAITSLHVMRNNAWVDVLTGAPTLPLTEDPSAAAAHDASSGAPTDGSVAPTAGTTAPPDDTAPGATEAADPTPAPGPATQPAAVTPSPAAASSASADDDLTPPSGALPEPAPTPRPAPAPLDRTEGAQAGPVALTILDPGFNRGTAGETRFAAFKGTTRDGEIVRAVIGDDPPGRLADLIGTPEADVYKVGQEVRVVGLWKNEWLVIGEIGIEPL